MTKLYFCENCADGTPWSYVGTLDEIIAELSKDTELSEAEVLDWMKSTERAIKENMGHMSTMKYHLDGEQWHSSIYEITSSVSKEREALREG